MADVVRAALAKLDGLDDIVANDTLAIVAANIGEFTEDELSALPNVWLSGSSKSCKEVARELMITLRIVSAHHGVPLAQLLPPFLVPFDKCSVCGRKRCKGYDTCNRH